MKKGKILFIDTADQELKKRLEKQGYECYNYDGYNREDYLKVAGNFNGLIVRSKIKLDAEFLSSCTNLKFIARVGAGMENIDSDFAASMGIECLNAPEGNRDAVAEHAVGMLLSLMNNLVTADVEVRKGIWIREGNRGCELGGRTVGIIGYGNTGSAFARKLKGFGVKVIAYDKYKWNFSNEYVTESTMDEIFDSSDIISFHIPLTDETRYLVTSDYISKFKKDIYLINTSRGKILRTIDLVDNLKSGKVRGACLDVLEYEGLSFESVRLPDEFKELISLRNVVLSPHIAGWTHESNYKMAVTLAHKIAALNI